LGSNADPDFLVSRPLYRQAQARDSIVTPQTAQIQELVRQIDETLRKSVPRFPWLQSSEAAQQRQVLQQTRSYLMVLQQQAREAEDRPLTGAASDIAGQSAETAQQVLQAVLQEMNYLRTNMLQPLRSDIDALQQRRSALVQEVQQLEARQLEARQQQALPAGNQQVAELLQSSMQQLQENLTGQVAEMLASLSASTEQPLLEGGLGDGLEGGLSPAQRLLHMQRLQAQSDQLTMRLDSAIRIIFESMHTNIKSYEDSLEQGLNRMHTLGQQGEAMFSALVNRLAEHLGRETSTYLQSSIQPPSLGAAPGTEDIDQLLGELNALERKNQAPDLESLDLSLDPLDFSDDRPTLIQSDIQSDTPSGFYEDEDITFFQHDFEDEFVDEDVTRFQNGSEQPYTMPTADAEDLSSALDLLNQLNGEENGEDAWAEAEADDEFYQSLFGEGRDDRPDDRPDDHSDDHSDDRPDDRPDDHSDDRQNIAEPPIETIHEATPIVAPEPEPEAELEPELAPELADVSDLFFSGMGDPADESEPEATAPLEFSDAELKQSVEAFLLKAPEPEAAPPPETIASLTELVSPAEAPAAPPILDEPFEENTYEPARPEESLLLDPIPPQPIRIDLDGLPEDTRRLLEDDLSNLEFSDSTFEPPLVPPVQVQADMTLFDDDPDAENPAILMQAFSNDEKLPDSSLELDPEDFDFSQPESTPNNAMPQDYSSTPAATPDPGENAFSFEGLDDDLFEPADANPDVRSLEPEDLLKKKRSRIKGERSRGFGR
jgi:hypothetical protein